MKKWLAYSTLFFVVYLGFLIVNVPVSWVINQVELPKGVDVKSPEGTVWNAQFEAIELPDNITLYNVKVDLSVVSIFMFNPKADITLGGDNLPGPQGQFSATNFFSTLQLSDVDLAIEANEILSQIELPLALTAHNKIDINMPEYEIGTPVCTVSNGKLRWTKAAITTFEETVELGALKANISCEKGLLYITMDPKNNLGLTYEVVIRSQKEASGNGFILPPANFPEQLTVALPFLGNPDGQGRYRLRF